LTISAGRSLKAPAAHATNECEKPGFYSLNSVRPSHIYHKPNARPKPVQKYSAETLLVRTPPLMLQAVELSMPITIIIAIIIIRANRVVAITASLQNATYIYNPL